MFTAFLQSTRGDAGANKVVEQDDGWSQVLENGLSLLDLRGGNRHDGRFESQRSKQRPRRAAEEQSGKKRKSRRRSVNHTW